MKTRLAAALLAAGTATAAPSYLIVSTPATAADPAWQQVVEALRTKHSAPVFTCGNDIDSALPELQRLRPEFTCFVMPPAQASREMVQKIHRLTRRIDADPYTDTRWGILTGYDAANALQIARESAPLTIRRVGSGTELAMDRITSGTWYCELRKGHMVSQQAGSLPVEHKVPADTTRALVDLMNDKPDLWVTSGHATERDWMIGYRYKNGFWKSRAGQLYGEDTAGAKWDVHSPNPKVYLPIGNCLMGHIDGPDAMALAFMQSAGVRQMAGYVLPTWYGYQGWGLLDYFVEQPGRYTLTEAFHANNIALVHRLLTNFPGSENIVTVDEMGQSPEVEKLPVPATGLNRMDLQGLLFDRDNVAFYGDPAWETRMAPGLLNWSQTLTTDDTGTHTFTITPQAGANTWSTVNKNGVQRGGRPLIAWLPKRIDPTQVKIIEGAQLSPVITDDFLLVPQRTTITPTTIRFTVK